MKKLYTAKETAVILRAKYRFILDRISAGKIKTIKVGKQYLISEEELNRLMNEGV